MKKALCLLLLTAAAAPLLCEGSVDCSGQPGFDPPPANQSSYVTYQYARDATTGLTCESVTQVCIATIPNADLSQRTWYITPTKSGRGINYKSDWIQRYNIQCPPSHVLHLFPQYLSTQADTNGACTDFDTVSIVAGNFSEVLCGGESARVISMLYNDGLGMVFAGGSATVDFCSNAITNDVGFVIRATCINLAHSFLPNCVDFSAIKSTDKGSDFIDIAKPPPEFATPSKANILHKRSVSLDALPKKEARLFRMMKSKKLQERYRRFVDSVGQFAIFNLTEDHRVIYGPNNMLFVDFNNGSTSEVFDVGWLVTVNPLLGTRIFDVEAPSLLVLRGPGKLEIVDGLALVDYTLSDQEIAQLVIESQEITSIINDIANYTFFNYIDPYPVVCTDEDDNGVFYPLPDASEQDFRYRPVSFLDFIQEDILNSTCERRVRIELAPGRNSFMEFNIGHFCRFFFNSCNPLLRAACGEAVNLDRVLG